MQGFYSVNESSSTHIKFVQSLVKRKEKSMTSFKVLIQLHAIKRIIDCATVKIKGGNSYHHLGVHVI